MRRWLKGLWCLTVVVLLALTGTAQGESAVEGAALAAMQAAHPEHAVAAQSQWGDTAAAVLSREGENILCLAEKRGGAWQVVIDNPAALWPGEAVPELLLDTDEVLYWTYHPSDASFTRYTAWRTDGQWRCTTNMTATTDTAGETTSFTVTYQDLGWAKVVVETMRREDANENLLEEEAGIPVPSEGLSELALLASFDAARFPCHADLASGRDDALLQGAAAQLLPGCTYLGGSIERNDMQLLVEKAEGVRVLAGVTFSEGEGWTITESTALPAGTTYGLDNFDTSLCLPGEYLAHVARFADGTWGVDCVLAKGSEMIVLGQNWIAEQLLAPQTRYYGDHPWSDMTTIDWTTLPESLAAAVAGLDDSAWAVVSNPDPADRLNLRASPDRDAASLGKYYSGTPVRVLEADETWVRVSVCGTEGYMMRAYLATGEAMQRVSSVGPQLTFRPQTWELYRTPQSESPFLRSGAEAGLGLRVIGVVGEEWYHVWFIDSGLSGYVRQEAMWAGNG